MKWRFLIETVISTLLVRVTLSSLAATSDSSELPLAATKHWTAANRNGTFDDLPSHRQTSSLSSISLTSVE